MIRVFYIEADRDNYVGVEIDPRVNIIDKYGRMFPSLASGEAVVLRQTKDLVSAEDFESFYVDMFHPTLNTKKQRVT